jgi:predicted acylesterase/phospholipase RssA
VAWQREQASLLLEPDMRSIGILDFRRFQQAADLGYSASKTALEAWTTRGTEGFPSREVIPHPRK